MEVDITLPWKQVFSGKIQELAFNSLTSTFIHCLDENLDVSVN